MAQIDVRAERIFKDPYDSPHRRHDVRFDVAGPHPQKHLTRFLPRTNSYPRSLAGAPYTLPGWPETHELGKHSRESDRVDDLAVPRIVALQKLRCYTRI